MQLVKLQNELQQFVNTERQNLQKKEVAVYAGVLPAARRGDQQVRQGHGLKLVLRQYETSLDESQPLPDIAQGPQPRRFCTRRAWTSRMRF